MRTFTLTALALAVAIPVAAQQADPDKPAKGGGKLPAGWQARTDKDAALDNVRFESMGPGWHVTTGPAVILWRPGDQAQGDFEASATLIQTKAPTHPEAYGIFVGGQALQGPEQSYTYFLVRGDGKFLIKRRTGTTTTNVTEGWTENAAVVKASTANVVASTRIRKRDMTNPLTIDFKLLPDELRTVAGVRAATWTDARPVALIDRRHAE